MIALIFLTANIFAQTNWYSVQYDSLQTISSEINYKGTQYLAGIAVLGDFKDSTNAFIDTVTVKVWMPNTANFRGTFVNAVKDSIGGYNYTMAVDSNKVIFLDEEKFKGVDRFKIKLGTATDTVYAKDDLRIFILTKQYK